MDISKDNAQQIGEYTIQSVQKLILGFMPGGHVIDSFLNYRSELKRDRLLKFFEGFKKALEENLNRHLTELDFNSEDFVDVMESIIGKVQITKCDFKLQRFKDILLRQLTSPINNQKTLKIISVVDELTDIQIIILNIFKSIEIPKEVSVVTLLRFHNRSNNYSSPKSKNIHVKVGNDELEVSRDDIDFLVTDLVHKGLLIIEIEEKHSVFGRNLPIQRHGATSSETIPVSTKSKTKYGISNFGRDVLDLVFEN